MIEITRGDILRADAEAIVNTVNCVGVMGRGIALQFKKAWPDNFKAYEVACKSKDVQLEKCLSLKLGNWQIHVSS
ncbi:ADP-ribose 1-phosphate phophatase related [Photobacterium aphoticum]|uniref:ADP-ribose 1-phosphate phophatase related n=1 Tax=Photobacterium aphoticum TaxID=754436 RepID=A0A090QT78_9GAMM|nr:ADP-ribose 1-phosphate phophatase related [Photobacterium aphoticum]